MKKVISVLLVLCMVFSFTACKSTEAEKSLYDVYENFTEQADAGSFELSYTVKIKDTEGTLDEDDEMSDLLNLYKTADNTYEFAVGLSGKVNEECLELAVSLGTDSKSMEDVFEVIYVDENVFVNAKTTYTFLYKTLKSANMLNALGLPLPEWDAWGFSGDYIDLETSLKAVSETFELEETLTLEDILSMLGSFFGTEEYDVYDYDYDYDYDYEYDYDFDFDDQTEIGDEWTITDETDWDDIDWDDIDWGDDDGEWIIDEDDYDDSFDITTIIAYITELFGGDVQWVEDIINAIPEKNVEAIVDAFESGLKKAGVVTTNNGWYTIKLGKNVTKIPAALAKSLDGNIAENAKAIVDAVMAVDTLPEELTEIISSGEELSLSDYEELEDSLIESLKEADLSDSEFAAGDISIEAKIKSSKKSTEFKLSVDADVEGIDVSASISGKYEAATVKVVAPTSLMSESDISGVLTNVLSLFTILDTADYDF